MVMLRRYLLNVLVGIDQLGNAVLAGDPDETITSRAAKAARAGRRWGCVLCQMLDWLQKDHCAKNIEPDEGGNAVDKSPQPALEAPDAHP